VLLNGSRIIDGLPIDERKFAFGNSWRHSAC
jgi:hypothetical protein